MALDESDRGRRIQGRAGGTGADELFSGYYDHHNAYLSVMKGSGYYQSALENWQRDVQPIVRNPFLADPDYYADDRDRREHIYLDASTFANNLNSAFEEKFCERKIIAMTSCEIEMANELMHESVRLSCTRTTLTLCSVSIENRSPFLDRVLFEVPGDTHATPYSRRPSKGGPASGRKGAPGGNRQSEEGGFNAPIFDF